MEAEEVERIRALAANHEELRHLWQRHERFESKLAQLQGVRYPSEADRRETQRIKRMKLRGKERIHEILALHPVR